MADFDDNDGRWYPEKPIVAVAAVVFRDGRVLAIKRAKDPGKGKWSIPGGRLELGETIYEGVRREVAEECSIEIEIERVLDVGENIIRDEDGRVSFHFVLIDLLAKYARGETEARSDAAECKWVTPEELAELDISATLRDVLKKAGII